MRTLRMLAVCGWAAVVFTTTAAAQAQIPWLTDWRQARDLALQQRRLVLLHFWSDSCEPCKRLEQHVFNRPEVVRAMSSGYIPVKVNVDQDPQLTSHYQVSSWPTDVIVDPNGRVVHRQISPQDPNQYIALLDSLKAHYGAFLAASPSLPSQAETAQGPATESAFLSLSGQASPPRNNPRDSAYFQANQSPNRSGAADGSAAAIAANPLSAAPSQAALISRPYANPYLRQVTEAPPAASSGPRGAAVDPRMANLIENPHLRPGSAQLAPQSRYGTGQGNTAAADSGATPPSQPVYAAQHTATPDHPARAQQTAATSPSVYGQPTLATSPPAHAQQTAAIMAQPTHAQPPVATTPRALPQRPLGSALDGYCPITLVEQNTWSKGDPRWGAEHRGRTYLFTSYVNQQRFLANPDLYSPILSGYDPVRYFDQGELVEGKREHGLYYGDQYFLFADESSLERFHHAPQRYVAQSQAAMRGN